MIYRLLVLADYVHKQPPSPPWSAALCRECIPSLGISRTTTSCCDTIQRRPPPCMKSRLKHSTCSSSSSSSRAFRGRRSTPSDQWTLSSRWCRWRFLCRSCRSRSSDHCFCSRSGTPWNAAKLNRRAASLRFAARCPQQYRACLCRNHALDSPQIEAPQLRRTRRCIHQVFRQFSSPVRSGTGGTMGSRPAAVATGSVSQRSPCRRGSQSVEINFTKPQLTTGQLSSGRAAGSPCCQLLAHLYLDRAPCPRGQPSLICIYI